MLTGCSICMGGSVDCSDWPRADCAVDFSPGGGGGGGGLDRLYKAGSVE